MFLPRSPTTWSFIFPRQVHFCLQGMLRARQPNIRTCRLYKLFSQAMDPLSGAAGLYFSYTNNITTTVQQHLDMDHNQPLWKRSIEEVWWNGAVSEPLRGMPLSLASQTSPTKVSSITLHIGLHQLSVHATSNITSAVHIALHHCTRCHLCVPEGHICACIPSIVHHFFATLDPFGCLQQHIP